jgi:hypothetical protein
LFGLFVNIFVLRRENKRHKTKILTNEITQGIHVDCSLDEAEKHLDVTMMILASIDYQQVAFHLLWGAGLRNKQTNKQIVA